VSIFDGPGASSLFWNLSLTPGFSPVFVAATRLSRFNGLASGSAVKRLKPFPVTIVGSTRLKPGVTERIARLGKRRIRQDARRRSQITIDRINPREHADAMNRRHFIQSTGLLAAGIALGTVTGCATSGK
jgi:hypothetical protein